MTVSKKIKWSLMIAAIVLGIGGALLTRLDTAAAKPSKPFYAAIGCVQPQEELSENPPAVH